MSVKAPFTPEQVDALNEYQKGHRFHPFTCGSGRRTDDAHSKVKREMGLSDWGTLVATPDGWICPACDYTQDWAHEFMCVPA